MLTLCSQVITSAINVYLHGEGVSKSQLDLIDKSPALFQWNLNAPEDPEKKSALNLGDATHALLLLPERFITEYAIGPANTPRNTKAGKAAWEAFEAKLYGQTVLSADEGRRLHLIPA